MTTLSDHVSTGVHASWRGQHFKRCARRETVIDMLKKPGWAGVCRTMLVMHPDTRGRSPFRWATQNYRPLGSHLRSPDSIVPRKFETRTVRRAYCTLHVSDASAHRAKVKPTVYTSSNGCKGFLPENDLLI